MKKFRRFPKKKPHHLFVHEIEIALNIIREMHDRGVFAVRECYRLCRRAGVAIKMAEIKELHTLNCKAQKTDEAPR